MKSFLGLSLEVAKKAADEMGLEVTVIHYRSKVGVSHSDSDIVLRQRQKEDRLELVVSAFKTKL